MWGVAMVYKCSALFSHALTECTGKYLGVNPALVAMGIERCPEFCDICVERGHLDMATGGCVLMIFVVSLCHSILNSWIYRRWAEHPSALRRM